MNWDQIDAEQEAYQSVTALLEQARKCEQLHQRAGLPLPERVQRLLGLKSDNVNGDGRSAITQRTTAVITAPERGSIPKGSGADWISIRVEDATVQTMMLAILRAANGNSVRSRDVHERVTGLLPNATSGSISNAGTRLFGDVIDRSDEGWKLLKPERAAILQDGFLWGPITVFSMQEIAAHRREAILHILGHFPTGLQVVQIVERLKACPWVQAPANKDMLKLDVAALLEAKRIRRRGNTKKWELAPVAEKDK